MSIGINSILAEGETVSCGKCYSTTEFLKLFSIQLLVSHIQKPIFASLFSNSQPNVVVRSLLHETLVLPHCVKSSTISHFTRLMDFALPFFIFLLFLILIENHVFSPLLSLFVLKSNLDKFCLEKNKPLQAWDLKVCLASVFTDANEDKSQESQYFLSRIFKIPRVTGLTVYLCRC